jgi:uncharacterized protein
MQYRMRRCVLALWIGLLCGMAQSPAKANDLYGFYAAYNQGDYAGAAVIVEPLARKGNAEAQYQMAAMFERGKAFNKDMATAVKWYTAAAEQGHALAQMHVAYAHEWGQGVEKNYFQAVKWYRKAALQKNAFAAYEIATLLYRGKGADRDPVMAVVMAHLAEVNGWKDASEFKEKVEAGLSHEQREHAEALFAQCIKSDYQYCQ